MNYTPDFDEIKSVGMQKILPKRSDKKDGSLILRDMLITVFASIISNLLILIHDSETYGYVHFLMIIFAFAALNKHYFKNKKKTFYCLIWFILASIILFGPILFLIFYISGAPIKPS